MAKLASSLVITLIIFFAKATSVDAIMVDKMVVSCEDQKIERMLAGDIYKQTFISETDEFGIIAVKFSNFSDISSDVLIFRIKESGQDGWYYENRYKVDQIQNDQFFPFGIPHVTAALGKEYAFELESTAGIPDDSIGIYLSQNDCTQTGQLIKNEVQNQKNIVFKLIEGVPFQQQLANDISKNATDDIRFTLVWLLSIAVVFALFIRKKK